MLWNSEPRTLLKHQVYRQYLRCWMGKICQRFPRSAIVDAFAGPGGYRDGPDGSPVVIAKTFLEHSGRQRFNQLSLICQEKRPDRRDELAARLASLPRAHRLEAHVPPAGELRDRFNALRSAAHGNGEKTPVLWILDPFDYSSAPFGLVRACLATPRDEVLITWFADEIYRFWFDRDRYGLTLGGGKINNPGRYLVLLPPINGATAASGTPYFTENPGDQFKAWDASATFDYMPSQYITFRGEFDHRAANVPYFSGPGGVTPSCPTAPIVENICGSPGSLVPGFAPDLKKIENRINLSILVKF